MLLGIPFMFAVDRTRSGNWEKSRLDHSLIAEEAGEQRSWSAAVALDQQVSILRKIKKGA